jgi:hypothetical protein
MAQIKFYDLEINTPQRIWSPNTCKTRFALNYKVEHLYFLIFGNKKKRDCDHSNKSSNNQEINLEYSL